MASFIPFGNPEVFDEFVQSLDVAAFETPLMREGKIRECELFAPLVKAAIAIKSKGPGGRPRFHPKLMFRVLVLQRLQGRADDATSFQITDRNCFRSFLGLTPGNTVPDGQSESSGNRLPQAARRVSAATQTISDFREALTGTQSFESLFDTFLGHLQKDCGLALAEEGILAGARLAEVPRQRNSREEKAQIKAGAFITPSTMKNACHHPQSARWALGHAFKNDFRARNADGSMPFSGVPITSMADYHSRYVS